jgi:hypothetical protein
MSVQQFAECFSVHIEKTVDQVIADIGQLGEDNLRSFLTWFRGLSEADRALFLAVSAIANAVLLKILTKAVGQTIAVAVLAFVGGASWVLLGRAFLECGAVLDT